LLDRRQAEVALRESEQRFRAIADNAPTAIFIKDLAGRYVFANPLACEALGRQDGVVGMTDHELLPAELADVLRRHDQEVVATDRSIEREEVVRSDTTERLFLSVKFPLHDAAGEIKGVCGVAVDITSRKQAEEAQAWLAAIVESSHDAIISKTLDGIITSWNAGAERIFGYTASETIGRSILLLIPPDRHAEEHLILERLRRGERIDHFETVRVAKDGRQVDTSVTISPIRDRHGRIVGASKIGRDISERRQVERKLRESEQRFSGFMQHLPGLAWIKDSAGRYVFANEAAQRAFGTSISHLLGKTDAEIFPLQTADQFQENDRQALASKSGIQAIETLKHEDGMLHHSLVSKFAIPDPDADAVMIGGMAIDISEQVRAEEALRDADRRKDEFLAMLAHELRNPLTPVRSGLDILATGTSLPNESVQLMQHQVEHLVRLVDDLLDVSRIMRGKIELRKQPVEIGAVVKQAVEALKNVVNGRSHELVVELPSEPLCL
jgi:PAS domain S-box-containing protein